ncbi:MAG TPA: hypothetical protein VIY72_15915 [Acidimicrobiales bacterium]
MTSVDPTTTTPTEAPSHTVDPEAVAAYLESIAPAAAPEGSNRSAAPAVGAAASAAKGGVVSAPPPTPSEPPFVAPTVTVDYTCIDSYPSWGFHVVVTASGGSGWTLNDVAAPGGVIATWDLFMHKAGDPEVPGGGVTQFPRTEDYVRTFPFYAQADGPIKASVPVSKSMSCTFHL